NDYAGSRSRAPATAIIVEDRLGMGNPGKYGSLNRVPYMMQRTAFHTNNMFMPLDDNENYNLPRLDVYVNNRHFPFTTADYRDVDLMKRHSPFWERYCLFPKHLKVARINPPNPADFTGVGPPPYFDINGVMIINGDFIYVGPSEFETGDPVHPFDPLFDPADPASTPLYGFLVMQWKTGPNGEPMHFIYRFLPPQKYPDAPAVGCMKMYTREYNNVAARRWCDGINNFDGCGQSCCHICPEERFDLDLSSQAVNENSGPMFDKLTGPTGAGMNCAAAADVPEDLRTHFSWQQYPVMAVQDTREDNADASYESDEMMGLRYGRPLKRHEYVDFPGPDFGEKPIAGDRDLEDEQVIKFLKVDRYFGVIEQARVLDMQKGDLNFSANDDEEVGFFYGEGVDLSGNIVTQSPVNMYTQVKDGTYMQIEETLDSITSTRQKNK
ncbi:MAG: hypothetical protein Q7T18_07585, partial [Sedimentisphaerales bacterium]|nr:hypothetical protein [Sedimentisphaerales bacterium]